MYNTGKYIQYTVITYNGKYSEKIYTYLVNHFAIHLKLTKYCKSTIFHAYKQE